MSLKTVREEDVPDFQSEGLTDGGHVEIVCSACDAKLLSLWRTRPHEKEIWNVRCNCPFCGDMSLLTKVKGGFHVSGIATSIPGEPDEDKSISTIYTDCQINNPTATQPGYFQFEVKKHADKSKPIYSR